MPSGSVTIQRATQSVLVPDGMRAFVDPVSQKTFNFPVLRVVEQEVIETIDTDHAQMGKAFAELRAQVRLNLPRGGDYSVDRLNDTLLWSSPPGDIAVNATRIGLYTQEASAPLVDTPVLVPDIAVVTAAPAIALA